MLRSMAQRSSLIAPTALWKRSKLTATVISTCADYSFASVAAPSA
jgi:hypothetical protein